MAQPAPKQDFVPETQVPAPNGGSTIDAAAVLEALSVDLSAAAVASPAKQMQNTLGQEFGALEGVEGQWSARSTMALVICTCGAFWTGLYFLIAALVG